MKATKLIIAGNTFVQLIGKIITAGITLLITLIIARNYGAVGYGEFTKIIAFVSLFYLIADFGLNAVWLKENSSNQQSGASNKKDPKYKVSLEGGSHSVGHNANYPFQSLFITRLVWAGVLIIAALIILIFLPYDPASGDGFNLIMKFGAILLLPTIVTQALFVSYNALFQKHLRYDRSVLAAGMGSITTLAVIFLASQFALPLPVIVSGYTAGGVVLAISAGILAKKYTNRLNSSSKKHFHNARRLMLLALPLGITLVLSLIHFKADIFILTLYRTTEEVGTYGLASKLFEFPLTLPVFFMNALYPVLLGTKNQVQKTKLRADSLYTLIAVSIAIVIVGMIAAPYIVLIRQEFTASILPFRILLLSLPVFFVSALYMWIFIARGMRWILVWVYSAGMLVNIGLNLVLIPEFGAPAAAVATGVSEVVILVLLVVNYSRYRAIVKSADI